MHEIWTDGLKVLPASAGMSPQIIIEMHTGRSAPRVSGDEPGTPAHPEPAPECSPRQRG